MIKFDWWGILGGSTGIGEWKVSADGSELQGTWESGGRGSNGTWNLKRAD